MNENNVSVKREQLIQAWMNWRSFHFNLECEELYERFFKYIHPVFEDSFVDDCLDWDNGESTYMVLPQTAEKIRMASEPNHYTVFKAWYVINQHLLKSK